MFVLPLLLLVSTIGNVFGDIRVPIFTAPLYNLSIPAALRSIFITPDAVEYYQKVTTYEIWQTPRAGSDIEDFDTIVGSTMFTILSDAKVIFNRGHLTVAKLEQKKLYKCPKWCYFVTEENIAMYTSYTLQQMNDVTPFTVRQLHDATVETMEKKFCFNMTVLEDEIGINSLSENNTQWELFVPKIVESAVNCRAAELGVTPSELGELLRIPLATLLAYDLYQVQDIFFPNFESLKARKNLFETQAFTVAISGMTVAGWQSKTMSYFANQISQFSVRDLEILYRWKSAPLYAIENISLSSYFSKCNSLTTTVSAFAISRSIYGYQDERPSCNVAYVLSRSLSDDEIKFNLATITDKNILYIIRNATAINSWFDFYQLLFSISEGIWMEMPFVTQVQATSGRSIAEIKSFSVPQIANLIRILNASNSLNGVYQTNYPQFLTLLLETYGISKSSLASITGTTVANIDALTIQQAHSLVFNALSIRYSISEFLSKLNVVGVDHEVAINLPSFEWHRLVRAAIQSSFAQLANAFSVNMTSGSGGIEIITLADGSYSIKIKQGSAFSSFIINTDRLATCLLKTTTGAIYGWPMSSYQTTYQSTVVDLMRKKISFETESLEAILTQQGITFDSIKQTETVAQTIANRVGLSQEQLRCLYGWSTQFSIFFEGITWGNVNAYRLCNDYTKWSLQRITVALQSSNATVCGMFFKLS